MVLKLIKHELKYLGRYLLLVWSGLILMIVVQRLLSEVLRGPKNPFEELIGMAAIMLLVFSVVAMFLITFGAIVMRFYQNMFTGEGYLTFTLPVKTWQILFSKLFVGWVFMLVPFLVTGLLLASYVRDPEVWYTLYVGFLRFISDSEIPLYVLIILAISTLFSPVIQLLEFYLAMSLGQLANRNKIIFSIIAYIGIYSVKQIFGAIVWASVAISGQWEQWTYYPFQLMSYSSVLGLVFMILLGTIYWLIVNYLCKKKLNLE